MIRFTRTELHHLLLSVLVLAIAASGLKLHQLAAVSLPLALGFVVHELAHKLVALRYGYWSTYRAWSLGLMLALLVGLASRGRFLFAAPGAVVILSPYFTSRQAGLIGLAGPATNAALAGCFYPLSRLPGMLGLMGYWGTFINLWLAFFNLLPLPPLDGSKVFLWNPGVWAAVEAPLLALMFLLG